jgi:hypothetical protein
MNDAQVTSGESHIYQVFRSRIEWLQHHTALVDVALSLVDVPASSSDGTLADALSSNNKHLKVHPASQWKKNLHGFSQRLNREHF